MTTPSVPSGALSGPETLPVDAYGYILRPDAFDAGFKGNPRVTVTVPLTALVEMEHLTAPEDRGAACSALKAFAAHIREKARRPLPVAAVGSWKRFEANEPTDALAWAKTGVAVYIDDPEKQNVARLYAPSELALLAAATFVGCNRSWIQGAGTGHAFFQLRGAPLDKALALCARGGA